MRGYEMCPNCLGRMHYTDSFCSDKCEKEYGPLVAEVVDDSYDRVLEAIDAYWGSMCESCGGTESVEDGCCVYCDRTRDERQELRWRPFSDEELKEIWTGLVYDDGLKYGQEPDSVEERLVRELEAEWMRRGRQEQPDGKDWD